MDEIEEDRARTEVFREVVITGLIQKNLNETLIMMDKLSRQVLEVYDHIDRIDTGIFRFKLVVMALVVAFCSLLLLVKS